MILLVSDKPINIHGRKRNVSARVAYMQAYGLSQAYNYKLQSAEARFAAGTQSVKSETSQQHNQIQFTSQRLF